MEVLTVNEEMLLIIIWKLKDEAYGFPILKKVMEATNRKTAYGTIYNTLDNMAKKGLLKVYKGSPTSERGGKSKVYYSITDKGKLALQRAKEFHISLWDEISDLAVE
ncbi:PadR family transcriptional regulator [candidate division KSB1 bacterium]